MMQFEVSATEWLLCFPLRPFELNCMNEHYGRSPVCHLILQNITVRLARIAI